jgi:hypothetical protein
MIAGALLLLAAVEIQGYVSDQACGWNNARPGKEARECARKCVEAGWPPVVVPDGGVKVLNIANRAAVKAFIGEHVTLTGDVKGETLTVKTIRLSPPKPKS